MIFLRPFLPYIAGAALLLGIGWFYGHTQYKAGVRETTARFLKADQKGADDVHETARKALDGIGDTDPDELLRNSGGLRD